MQIRSILEKTRSVFPSLPSDNQPTAPTNAFGVSEKQKFRPSQRETDCLTSSVCNKVQGEETLEASEEVPLSRQRLPAKEFPVSGVASLRGHGVETNSPPLRILTNSKGPRKADTLRKF